MAERRPPGALGTLIQRELLDRQKFKPPSYRELADRVDVLPTTFGDWMAGKLFPKPADLQRLAAVTEISYDRLLEAALIDAHYRTPIDYVWSRDKGGGGGVSEIRDRDLETGLGRPSGEVGSLDPHDRQRRDSGRR